MTIGIIGAGNIGLAVAKTLARAGIAATIASSRGPDSLTEAVRPLGPMIEAGTREKAASADMVLIAANWSKLPAAVVDLERHRWSGELVDMHRAWHMAATHRDHADAEGRVGHS